MRRKVIGKIYRWTKAWRMWAILLSSNLLLITALMLKKRLRAIHQQHKWDAHPVGQTSIPSDSFDKFYLPTYRYRTFNIFVEFLESVKRKEERFRIWTTGSHDIRQKITKSRILFFSNYFTRVIVFADFCPYSRWIY